MTHERTTYTGVEMTDTPSLKQGSRVSVFGRQAVITGFIPGCEECSVTWDDKMPGLRSQLVPLRACMAVTAHAPQLHVFEDGREEDLRK